ncbi:MAG: hypothetical protein ACRC6M_14995 [Microcystaceae cyanobacterium]
MSHFNLKSLAFYGAMIGSVLILFKFVTTYGESNLKAATNLSGDYPLKSETLPDCLKGQNLNLLIEQSGRYLFGKLTLTANSPQSPTENSSTPNEKPNVKPEIIKLNGLFSPSPLILTSSPTLLGSCSESPTPVTVQIQLPEKLLNQGKASSLVGELRWSSRAIAFTAEANKPLSLKAH